MQFSNVKWLKFPVDLIYSSEVMSMRRARRNGKSTRDLLLCFWVELFALAGSLNENGLLLRNGIAMEEQDFADAFCRRIENIRYGLDWLLQIGMLTIDSETGAYAIPGWADTQSTEKLKNVRRARREACDAEPAEEPAQTPAEEKAREEEIREEKNKEEEKRQEEKRAPAAADGNADADVDTALRKSLEEEAKRRKDPVLYALYMQKKIACEEERRRQKAGIRDVSG